MNITQDEQRKLTEFLGECWHEFKPRNNTGTDDNRFDDEFRCVKCDRSANTYHGMYWSANELNEKSRLDFNDWRVVGRLIEKAGGYIRIWKCDGKWKAAFEKGLVVVKARPGVETPQAAICNAILVYIKER